MIFLKLKCQLIQTGLKPSLLFRFFYSNRSLDEGLKTEKFNVGK